MSVSMSKNRKFNERMGPERAYPFKGWFLVCCSHTIAVLLINVVFCAGDTSRTFLLNNDAVNEQANVDGKRGVRALPSFEAIRVKLDYRYLDSDPSGSVFLSRVFTAYYHVVLTHTLRLQ